jgi:hypothetical protein
VVGIVRSSQVGEDRKAFHDSEASLVVVHDDGNATVRPEFGEPYARRLLAQLSCPTLHHDLQGSFCMFCMIFIDCLNTSCQRRMSSHTLRDAITRCSPFRMLP